MAQEASPAKKSNKVSNPLSSIAISRTALRCFLFLADLNGNTPCDEAVSRGIYHRVSILFNWIQRTTCQLTKTPPLHDAKPEVIPIGTRFRNAALEQRPSPVARQQHDR